MQRKRRYLSVAVALAVTVAMAAALGWATRSPASQANPKPFFSALAQPGGAPPEPQLDHLATLGDDRADFMRLHVLVDHVGRFDSRVVAWPSTSGRITCYSLIGATPTDPAMAYCSPTRRQFKPSALESLIDGTPGVQLFGIASDSVVGIRVSVGGMWRDVPLTSNGFYLDLPGVRHAEVGVVEATLRNGRVERYDLQTAQYE